MLVCICTYLNGQEPVRVDPEHPLSCRLLDRPALRGDRASHETCLPAPEVL